MSPIARPKPILPFLAGGTTLSLRPPGVSSSCEEGLATKRTVGVLGLPCSSSMGLLTGETEADVDRFLICFPLAGDSTLFSSKLATPFGLLALYEEKRILAALRAGEMEGPLSMIGVPFVA